MKGLKIPLLFAFRYLFSKKSVNAINIISFISFIGVLVSTAALVIVLSFYNGMEKFILSLYSSFTPDLRIEPTKGKTFDPKTITFEELRNNNLVKNYLEVLEDKILIQHDNVQFIGQLKGIDVESFNKLNQQDILQNGKFTLEEDSIPYSLIGAQIQANLRIPINNIFNNIELYFPRKGVSINNINPLEDFNIRNISVSGTLAYQPEFENLVITPLTFARDILGEDKNISALEIYLNDPQKTDQLQQELQHKLKGDFYVKNREQQDPTLYKTIKSEKWIVFFILTFIGIIAIFNIIGSLTMLVIDKKDDMKVLQHLGAERSIIERIFFIEGLMISLLGSIVGILLGYAFCVLQETYGFIRTGDTGGSMIDIYPIDIRLADFLLVFMTVFILSTIVAFFSSKLSVKGIGRITELKSSN